MLYYLTAAGLILHTFFWGAGLALFWSPRAWRPGWWALAPALGQALQSAVVWAGAHSALAGTDAYAWWTELLPLALLLAALGRDRGRAGRRALGSLRAAAGVAVLMAATGWLLVSPLRTASRELTTTSLGSCDQADYAAGARVFQEFSRHDHTGFLGLPEVTKVRSADYFFDFWLRLNHFTPSALLAHNGTIFGYRHYQLVGVSAAVLVLLNLPVVLLLARVTLKLRGAWLLGVVALYAVSPLQAYAVHHGALGQIYAAQGIALLTLALVSAGRAVAAGRPVRVYWPLLLAAFWLLAGSYNFILTVCLAPAGAWLLAQAWSQRSGRVLVQPLLLAGSALAACVGLFWGRFDGLIERFGLFEQYNFGWPVPLQSPEGWLGLLRDVELHAGPLSGRVLLSALVVTGWLAGVVHWWRRDRSTGWLALALVLPVLAGWSILAWETRTRANASYDAYKLIAVFLPGILIGVSSGLAAVSSRSPRVQAAARVILLALVAANLVVAAQFRRRMEAPPLRVDHSLRDLGRLEGEPRIHSLNMLVDDYWSRIWANAFLLRLPQYFTIHTYEGRLDTPLKGEWNLQDSLLRIVPAAPADYLPVNERFFAVRAGAVARLRAQFGPEWYAEEHAGPSYWRWTPEAGTIQLGNSTGAELRLRLTATLRGLTQRNLELEYGPARLPAQRLDGSIQKIDWGLVILPPGSTVLKFHTDGPAAAPGGDDARALSVALYGLELQVQPGG